MNPWHPHSAPSEDGPRSLRELHAGQRPRPPRPLLSGGLEQRSRLLIHTPGGALDRPVSVVPTYVRLGFRAPAAHPNIHPPVGGRLSK
jgi:hypothetical protein